MRRNRFGVYVPDVSARANDAAGDILPTFVTAASVTQKKQHLMPFVLKTNHAAISSKTLPKDLLVTWQSWLAEWQEFYDRESSEVTAAADANFADAHERELAKWQATLKPYIGEQPMAESTSGSSNQLLGTIDTLGKAAIVIGIVWLAHEFLK